MKRSSYGIAALFLMSVALVDTAALAAERLVTVGTAGVTGVYYPAGGAICRLMNRARKEHGMRCVVESTGGSLDNLDSIREGELDMGVVQSDLLYHARNGSELFATKGPNAKLRVVFALHPEPFTILARRDAGVVKLDDLKGKRVNIGAVGSGMRATMEEIMKLKGWNESTFHLVNMARANDQGQALCERKLEAMTYTGGHPNATVQQITMACDVRMIGVERTYVERIMQDHPYYTHAVIPAGLYRGTPDAISTFGVRAAVVASEDLDPEIVYQMTKAVFDNLDSFKTLHPVFTMLDQASMVGSLNAIAPLHEGALRYYRERGWIK